MHSAGYIITMSLTTILLGCGLDDSEIDYNTQVKPILNEKCISCHGGVKKSGGFGLLTREQALSETDNGEPAIIPGHASKSSMISRLMTEDPELRMPQEADPLSREEIKILRQWINEGANWDLHWSYKPLRKIHPPEIQALGTLGATDAKPQAIDLFILEELQKKGLGKLMPRADDTTILRRVSLDLIGIPTTQSLREAFLNRKITYSQLVDSLLASPQFGEKWASMWLDLARYADSKGYERDPHRDIWQYRDWVIRALNDDLPYDTFLTEQLAGDMVENPTDDQLIATAFHRNTPTNDEGGTDNEEYRTYAVIDRVNTTWEGILGTTFACVQCHSHPYDPFTQKEYFQFLAYFNNTRDADTSPDYPLLRHFTGEDSTKLDSLLVWAGQHGSVEEVRQLARFVKTWQPVYYSIETDSFVNSDLYDTKYLGLRQNGSARLKSVELSNKNVVWMRYRTSLKGGTLNITTGQGGAVFNKILDPTKGYEIVRIPLDTAMVGTHDLILHYDNPNIKNPDQAGAMFDWFRFACKLELWEHDLDQTYERMMWHLLKIQTKTTPIMVENPPEMTRTTQVFERGNWLVKGERVEPGVPRIIQGAEKIIPNRMGLANWIASPNNPLTPRTMVNRLWSQIFGRGLVETVEDLGSLSPPPSHPQLLEWLAWSFVHEHQWSIKDLLKVVVCSETYLQQSRATDKRIAIDPNNDLLSRGARVRLTGEQIRDQALAVSGLLNLKMYGPSVMPPQPIQWSTPYSNAKWVESTGDDRYRRAIYTYWKRSLPYPAMMIFDGAARDVCEARRIQTNTPLHALVTLNDPVYIEAAAHLAKMMHKVHGKISHQIATGYKSVLGHNISKAKTEILIDLYEQSVHEFEDGTSNDQALLLEYMDDGSAEVAALTIVANAIMNMDEFISKN